MSLPSLQDEQSAMLMLKRHMILKQDVDDYADSIQKLSDRAQRMLAEEHPDGFVLLEIKHIFEHLAILSVIKVACAPHEYVDYISCIHLAKSPKDTFVKGRQNLEDVWVFWGEVLIPFNGRMLIKSLQQQQPFATRTSFFFPVFFYGAGHIKN